MSKYSEKLKLKIVLEHQNEHTGYRSLSSKYGIERSIIRQWCVQYEENGEIAKPTRHFSSEFKLKVLNYQQEHNLSDLKTALLFGITNKGTISTWRKKYITGGQKALFRTQGKQPKMPKKSLIPNKPREEWTEQEELAYLRMENDFLKKYLALVQEDDKKKQQQKKEQEKSLLSKN